MRNDFEWFFLVSVMSHSRSVPMFEHLDLHFAGLQLGQKPCKVHGVNYTLIFCLLPCDWNAHHCKCCILVSAHCICAQLWQEHRHWGGDHSWDGNLWCCRWKICEGG